MSIRKMPGAWPEDDAECIPSAAPTSTAESTFSASEIAKSDLTSEPSLHSSPESEYRLHPWDATPFRYLQEPRYTVADEARHLAELREAQREAQREARWEGGLRARLRRYRAALKKARFTKGVTGEVITDWEGA
jgi:hypothetical protein